MTSLYRGGRAALTVGLMLTVALLVACSSGDDSTAEPTGTSTSTSTTEPTAAPTEQSGLPTGGTLTVAHSVDFLGLDPHLSNSPTVFTGYETLVWPSSTGEPTPILAESWSSNDDATVWTFELREGVLFHDGTDFNAEAVKANFDRIFELSPFQNVFAPYFNADGVEVMDTYTVRFSLLQPSGVFPFVVGDRRAVMASPAAFDTVDLDQNVVGTGAFKLVSFEPSNEIVWERNPEYWQTDEDGVQLPYLDGMVWRIMPDTNQRLAAVRAGEVQFAGFVDSTSLSTIEDDDTLQAILNPGAGLAGLVFDTSMAPFDNPDLVRGLMQAIDREAIMNVAFNGVGTPAFSVFSTDSIFFSDQYLDEISNQYDPEAAQALIDQAGYSDGLTIEVPLIVGNVYADSVRAAEMIQQMWAQVGVQVEVAPTTTPDLVAALGQGGPPLMFYRGSTSSTPVLDLPRHYGGGSATYHWAAPENVAALIAAAIGEPDQEAQIAAAQEAQLAILAASDQARFEIAHVSTLNAASADLLNYIPAPGAAATDPWHKVALATD